MNTADRLFAWTPYGLSLIDEEIVVDWCHLAHRRLVEPLFRQSIAAAMGDPFNLVFQQRTDAKALATLPPGLPPQGFIFHAAPSAATALAQALAACENAVVVSQARPLQAALELRRADLLAGLVNAYAQQRFAYELCLFVVFAAADVRELALVRRAFPDVPWLFLYRDPNGREAGTSATWDDCSGAVVAYAEAALSCHHPGGRGLILDVADLPAALDATIPAHFNFAPDVHVTALMRAALTHALASDRTVTSGGGCEAAGPIPEPVATALRRATTRP